MGPDRDPSEPSDPTRTLLRLASLLGPTPIPVALLGRPPAECPDPYPSPEVLEATLDALARQGSLVRQGSSVVVEGVLRAELRATADGDSRWRQAAAELVRTAMPEHVDVRPRLDAWLEVSPLVAHVDALSDGVEPGHPLAAVIAELERAVGWALMGFGDFASAHARYARALALRLPLDEAGLETARSHQDVGQALTMLGQAEAARSHLERALELRRRAHGSDDPELVPLLVALGTGRAATGALDAARSTMEEALALSMRLSGTGHPLTATLQLVLASLLRARADDEAQAAARHHQTAALRVLDDPGLPPSWDAVTALLSIGPATLGDEVDQEVPPRLARRAVDMVESLVGSRHPVLGIVLARLGVVRQLTGDSQGALGLLERAVATLEAAGPDGEPFLEGLIDQIARLLPRSIRASSRSPRIARAGTA